MDGPTRSSPLPSSTRRGSIGRRASATALRSVAQPGERRRHRLCDRRYDGTSTNFKEVLGRRHLQRSGRRSRKTRRSERRFRLCTSGTSSTCSCFLLHAPAGGPDSCSAWEGAVSQLAMPIRSLAHRDIRRVQAARAQGSALHASDSPCCADSANSVESSTETSPERGVGSSELRVSQSFSRSTCVARRRARLAHVRGFISRALMRLIALAAGESEACVTRILVPEQREPMYIPG